MSYGSGWAGRWLERSDSDRFRSGVLLFFQLGWMWKVHYMYMGWLSAFCTRSISRFLPFGACTANGLGRGVEMEVCDGCCCWERKPRSMHPRISVFIWVPAEKFLVVIRQRCSVLTWILGLGFRG